MYGGFSIYHIQLILDFFHIFRVQYITKLSKISAKSIIGSNMRIICRRLKLDNISHLMNMGSCMLKRTYIEECTVEDHIALSVIQELRSCMSGSYFINGFPLPEIDATLKYIYVPCKETVKILYLYV